MKHLLHLILIIPFFVAAQPGTLDPLFGIGGMVVGTTGMPGQRGLAIQSDGKIIVSDYFHVRRLMANGSDDVTFQYDDADVYSIGVLAAAPDGSIFVGGGDYHDFASKGFVMKLHPDGSIDSTFGGDGVHTIPSGDETGGSFTKAILPDPSGKVTAAGPSTTYDAAIYTWGKTWRLNTNGTLDPAFGSDGIATSFPFDQNVVDADMFPLEAAIQTDGKIVVAGYWEVDAAPYPIKEYSGLLMRMNAEGILDPSFGGDGYLMNDSTSLGCQITSFDGLALQSDGKIIVGGPTESGNFGLYRFDANGAIDSLFGLNGLAEAAFPAGESVITKVRLQPDGKIIASGNAMSSDGDWDFALARFNTDGTIDNSFGTNGLVTTDFSGDDDKCYNCQLQADGTIVLSGSAGMQIGVTRYLGGATRIIETSLDSGVKVSPNPAKDNIIVEASEGQILTLTDATGKIVMELTTADKITTLDLSKQPAGIYLLRVGVATQRVVKQ